jgi:hypothetical protein
MFAAVALAVALQAGPTGAVDPASPEGAAVMAPVNALFQALADRDGQAILPHIDPAGKITVVAERPDGTRRTSSPNWTEFVDDLTPGPERFEEIMPDPFVAIDGDIAVVWGRYVFKVDGAISHCGVDHFDLVRREGVWKIVNITWSQRTTGCEGL